MIFSDGHIENDLQENAANCVNGVVPIQPFPHQPIERRGHHRCVAHGGLIFDDDMSCGVSPGAFTNRQLPAAVVV